MDSASLLDIIEEEFKEKILESSITDLNTFVVVDAKDLVELSLFLKNDERMKFDFLRTLTGVDKLDWMESIFVVYSYELKHQLMVKVELDRKKPSLPTVSHIWKAANWYEREMFDLFGINYEGHPNLRRLMMPDDWVGHPLRKDYQKPKKYHDIDLYRFNPVLDFETLKPKEDNTKEDNE